MAGTLGRNSLPRAVASKLIALSSWFCQEEPRTIVQAQKNVGGRWFRAVQFRRELSFYSGKFWEVDPLGKIKASSQVSPRVYDR